MHADREEEYAEQQAAERVDHRLDSAAVFGLGQQQAREEGAQCHRQASEGRDHARAHGDQQGGGHEEFRVVAVRGQPEERTQQHAADDHDRGQGDQRLSERHADTQPDRALHVAAQHADQQQQRDHGEILGEQDGEAGAAGRAGEAPLSRQQLHHDGGRGQGEAGADHQGGGGRLAGPQRQPADRGRGQHHLQAAQAEHQAAHGEQAPQRQFEADEEQQEDDAEIGDEGDLFLAGHGEPIHHRRMLGQPAEAVGTEQRTDHEIAQHRAHLEARQQRRHHRRRRQNDQRVLEGMYIADGRHRAKHRRWPPIRADFLPGKDNFRSMTT